MIAVDGQHVPFAAVVVHMGERRAGVRRCYTFLPLLPRVRFAVPDPADRGGRRCSTFLPLPPLTRSCRPIRDVMPEVMPTVADRV